MPKLARFGGKVLVPTFRKVYVYQGTIMWGDDLDYCANVLYDFSEPLRREKYHGSHGIVGEGG